MRRLKLCLPLLAGACAPRSGEPVGDGSTTGVTSVVVPSTGSPAETSGGSDASSTGAVDDSGGSGSTTVRLDVGELPDGGDPQPAGCKGKIDFLFVISRAGQMGQELEGYGTIHDRLVAAIPDFFTTIETKFADFDYHILVTKGDPYWGGMNCNAECPGPFTEQCKAIDYPCEMVGKVSACDQTWGAGVVFNAGWLAPNKPCEIAGGKRYLAKGQPNLLETFTCIAQVGASGSYNVGQALAAAVSPALTEPGGCNEGFLRDDALLVVTVITNTADVDSEGTPASWAQAVFDAKGGDSNAVVLFQVGVTLEYCENPPWDNPLCGLLDQFPLRTAVYSWDNDYGPGFEAATDLILEACASFIPG